MLQETARNVDVSWRIINAIARAATTISTATALFHRVTHRLMGPLVSQPDLLKNIQWTAPHPPDDDEEEITTTTTIMMGVMDEEGLVPFLLLSEVGTVVLVVPVLVRPAAVPAEITKQKPQRSWQSGIWEKMRKKNHSSVVDPFASHVYLMNVAIFVCLSFFCSIWPWPINYWQDHAHPPVWPFALPTDSHYQKLQPQWRTTRTTTPITRCIPRPNANEMFEHPCIFTNAPLQWRTKVICILIHHLHWQWWIIRPMSC